MKRGQAAMEFLMTYGWVLLVILIAVAAMAYFGLLKPGDQLPETCFFFPGLGCNDFKANNESVVMMVTNGMGINLVNVSITESDGGTEVCNLNCSSGCTGSGFGNYSMPDGELTTWGAGNCTDVGTAGSKFKGDILFAYVGTGGLSHSKTGTITTQVE
jgi:hypothetical protein